MKNSIKKIIFLQCLLAALFLSGCARYKPHVLQYAPDRIKKADCDVEIGTKTLSLLDCKTYFGTISFLKKGFRSIQISITNKTDTTYILNGSNIGLQLECGKYVARTCHFNTAAHIALWSLGIILLWKIFIPVAAIAGYTSYKANCDIDFHFEKCSINTNDQIIITPHSLTHKVIFVSNENYQTYFDIDLIEKDTNKQLTFKM